MIKNRHIQIAKAHPGVQKEIENDKQQAENIAKILVERSSSLNTDKDDLI